jgi:4-amino-4-deoxy-L-arabinose transferase-like glycosyltransferase
MIWKIFFSALTIRWVYALALFATMGEPGLKGVDSYTYVGIAQQFSAEIAQGSVHGWDWLGPHTAIMPFYNALISLIYLLFGKFGAIAFVLAQGAIDAATCVLVLSIVRAIEPRYALAAAIAAVINPTQIVMSGLIYPDTTFVFFVALSFYGTVRWLRLPSPGNAALIAIALSCAALIRILIVPWAAVVVVFLACVTMIRSRLAIQLAGQLVGIAIVLLLCVGVVLGRNVAKYQAWSLTSQEGIHLQTVVPWVRWAHDGTPWTLGHEELMTLTERRYPTSTQNPFEESRREAEVAAEQWRTLGLIPTVKAWVYGAAINLGSPAVILSPPLIQIPRTGFYGTPGASMTEKIANFVFHSESAIYNWALLIGGAGVALVRIVQAAGVIEAIGLVRRDRRHGLPIVVLFALWFGFILAVNGPVASPKYRLPLEPVLNILTGMGFCALSQRRRTPLALA